VTNSGSLKIPTLLSVETSTAAGSVAVLFSPDQADEKVLAQNEWLRSRSHAEVATPAIEDAVHVAGGWSKIDALAVGVGPGSFTGIRVGLNAVRAIAWSTGRAVITVRSTDALIEGARSSGLSPWENTIVAVLNAQMGLNFAAWASGAGEITSPEAMDTKTLEKKLKALKQPITLIGDAADAVALELQALGRDVFRPRAPHLDFPHALTVARLAGRVLRVSSALSDPQALVRLFDWRAAQPLYIRGSGAEEKMG